MAPGFRALEGREEQLLARQTLADLLVRAEAAGDASLVADVQALSHRLGEGGAEAFLRACARAPDAMAALGSAAPSAFRPATSTLRSPANAATRCSTSRACAASAC